MLTGVPLRFSVSLIRNRPLWWCLPDRGHASVRAGEMESAECCLMNSCFKNGVVEGKCFKLLSLCSGGHSQPFSQPLVAPRWFLAPPQVGFTRTRDEVAVIFMCSTSPTCALHRWPQLRCVSWCHTWLILIFPGTNLHFSPALVSRGTNYPTQLTLGVLLCFGICCGSLDDIKMCGLGSELSQF